MSDTQLGVLLHNGCRITHGAGSTIKHPFPNTPLVMHELSPNNTKGFKGPLGFIEFTSELRLPRHIHMDLSKQKLVDERIMVLHGVGMVELAGEVFVVAPGSLVDAVGGVPHTWTACPEGVVLPGGEVAEGRFTMVYEYEEPTAFFPTRETEVVRELGGYRAWEGDLEEIRFPKLSVREVVENAKVVWDREVCKVKVAE